MSGRADVVVLGSGVAGLTAALAACRAGLSVAILTKGELAHSATRYAQGGVAAALSPPDSPELHRSDTVSAGGGLCDDEAVRVLCGEGPARLRDLIALGAAFDHTAAETGSLALAREGGHSLARVVHAGGDATGHEVERALVAAVLAAGVDVTEHWFGRALAVENGVCTGVAGTGADGQLRTVRAEHVVLASGGAGQLFAVTTNPALSTGDGIAMALLAGAAVADVEFMQFHPTALHHPAMPRPLLSEALRGEGAVLRDEDGVAFMAGEHPLADLAPRDVVSRAIARRLADRGLDHLWLDATGIDRFPERFPTIWRACRDAGLDPRCQWLPVAPAAHYLSGGVVTDLHGATSIPGLWACGEVACTGVHGANRLASNSLLEGLVFGHRAGAAIAEGRAGPEPSGALRGVPLDASGAARGSPVVSGAPPRHGGDAAGNGRPTDGNGRAADGGRRAVDGDGRGGDGNGRRTAGGHRSTPDIDVAALRERLQRSMTRHAGVLRAGAGLESARADIDAVAAEAAAASDDARAVHELRSLVAVGAALVAAAIERRESRGAHFRIDFPDAAPEPERIVHLGAATRVRVPAAVAGAGRSRR